MSTSTTTSPAVQALLDEGWTRDSAEAHVGRYCNRDVCSGDHPNEMHFSLAIGLLRAHLDLAQAGTPTARNITSSFLLGMVEAAFRVGIGRTPTEVAQAVRDAVVEAPERPEPFLGDRGRMQAVRAWDTDTATDLAYRLAAL